MESGSVDEVIRRGNVYASAGADMIFASGLKSVDEIRRVMGAVRAPAFAGVPPFCPYPELSVQREWGMAMTLYGSSQIVAAKAVWD